MKTLEELYHDILERKVDAGEALPPEYHPYHLDCLLHPEKYAPVIFNDSCEECAYDSACQKSCIFDAIEQNKERKMFINPEKCVGCGACIDACKMEKLTESKDILPVMKAVREGKTPVYMMIAPAFLGQFSEKVTPGKLRTAFRALGFTGMIEVALFADILTLKEALEFDRNVQHIGDYQLTSCCCPIWIAMIRKMYTELIPHVPGAVSPMVACGRVIKALYPEAITVFAGPCIAKKSEAREPDIADAVDYVLTFQEIQDIFDVADIHPEELSESEKEHSSHAGRIYARVGGVSEAVQKTVAQLCAEQTKQVKAEYASGVPECRALIERIKNKETDANFFEGMGCRGGCVGGPKAVLPAEEGAKRVNAYADNAPFATPLENPYVIRLLKELGYETIDDFVEHSELLVRKI